MSTIIDDNTTDMAISVVLSSIIVLIEKPPLKTKTHRFP